MKELINAIPIRKASQDSFRMAFHWYNEIDSRKITLSDDDLDRIFERIHTKALEVYDHTIWGSLETDGDTFWYSENPDKEAVFPLAAVLVNYGNAILQDSFPEIANRDDPEKASVEIFFLVFIYAYAKSMKLKEDVTTHLPPELLSYAIDPLIVHLIAYVKDMHSFNSLSINFMIEILRLNNKLNQANRLEGLYNQPALNKIWERKSDDTVIGVIMLDGDHFKKVNDNCGHGVGDEVLEIYRDSILSAIELSRLKTRAFSARCGGEEFCVCIFDSNEKEIIDLSKKIKSELESHVKWEELRGRKYEKQEEPINFPRTFSQGIALGKKSDFIYLNALVDIADKQMYRAKNDGNRDCIYYNDRKVSE